ncbi:MAG TPA: hypothetical protein VK871_03015, partial [Candidatus Limnocylindrales bacterium]|nr:hypothetical protein [Candidatus Limnocylindrales bacterium]
VAGAVTDVEGRTPAERVAAIVGRPPVIGRLWYTPGTGTAAAGKVEIGGHLAAGIADGNGAELLTAVAQFAWLGVLGLGVLLPVGLIARKLQVGGLARARTRATDPPERLRLRLAPRALARAALVAAPLGVAGLLVLGLAAPAFAQPAAERDGTRLTIRTWDGRTARRPPGVATSVTFGSSPSGNAVVLPPRPARSNSLSDPYTSTRGTFAPVGGGREAVVLPPVDWDVISHVVVWFGPTFDPAAAAEVAIGPYDDGSPSMTTILRAADLALGAVAVRLPVAVRGVEDEALRLTVRPVDGAPVPDVSVRGDGSLAWSLRGLRSVRLPVLTAGGSPLLTGVDPFYTLPESSSLVIDETGARMRIGPWGPEQILRASDHPGWLLPGPTTLPGTWGDSTAPGKTGEPLVLAIDGPFPLTSLTAHAIVTPYTDPTPAGAAITIEASLDGLSWQLLASLAPVETRRQAAVAGRLDLPTVAARVLIRISPTGAPGSIGLNGLWFDLELAAPPNELGAVRSEDLEVFGRTAGSRGFAPLQVEVAGGVGTINRALHGWGTVSGLVLGAPGAFGAMALAIALGAGAVVSRRRRLPRP